MRRSVLTVDRFFEGAPALRAHFDARFENPRDTPPGRFVWDFWHVPGQYTALRTPAYHYFPRAAYEAFHQHLVWWGRRTLGCHDVSPPWLSCYIDGCEQNLHGDVPHGQWAFVYSLTPWRTRRFTGGQTLLLRDEVLDWWSGFTSAGGVEEPDVLREVAPLFNRLTVFDPRIPHGVRRVEGVRDPREGRLVIHGWFVQPRPFVEGPLPTAALQARIGELTRALGPRLEEGLALAGLLSVGFTVSARGVPADVRVLSDTTRTPAHQERARRALAAFILRAIRGLRFPKCKGPSRVTLPLVFER
jgi:hypothetical protein